MIHTCIPRSNCMHLRMRACTRASEKERDYAMLVSSVDCCDNAWSRRDKPSSVVACSASSGSDISSSNTSTARCSRSHASSEMLMTEWKTKLQQISPIPVWSRLNSRAAIRHGTTATHLGDKRKINDLIPGPPSSVPFLFVMGGYGGWQPVYISCCPQTVLYAKTKRIVILML